MPRPFKSRFKGPGAPRLQPPLPQRSSRPSKSPPEPRRRYPGAPAAGLRRCPKGPAAPAAAGSPRPFKAPAWGSWSGPAQTTGSCRYAVPHRTSLLSPLTGDEAGSYKGNFQQSHGLSACSPLLLTLKLISQHVPAQCSFPCHCTF